MRSSNKYVCVRTFQPLQISYVLLALWLLYIGNCDDAEWSSPCALDQELLAMVNYTEETGIPAHPK